MVVVGNERSLKAVLLSIVKTAKKLIKASFEEKGESFKSRLKRQYAEKKKGIAQSYKMQKAHVKTYLGHKYKMLAVEFLYTSIIDEVDNVLNVWVERNRGNLDYTEKALAKAERFLGSIDSIMVSSDFFEAFSDSPYKVERVFGDGILVFKKGNVLVDFSPAYVVETFRDEIIKDVLGEETWDISLQ